MNNVFPNVLREDAKSLIIRLIYGGKLDAWVADCHVTSVASIVSTFVSALETELATVEAIVVNENPHMVQQIIKNKERKGNDKDNLESSALSYLCQEIEQRMLEAMVDVCKERGYIQNNVAILCFDGLMLAKEYLPADTGLVLRELEAAITERTGFTMRLTIKEMNAAFSTEQLEASIVEQDSQAEGARRQYLWDYELPGLTYEQRKTYFELHHFKILENKGIYMRHGRLMSLQDMRNIYLHLPDKFIKAWLQDENIRRYETVGVFPDASKCPENVFNLWTGFAYAGDFEYEEDREGLEFILQLFSVLSNHIPAVNNLFLDFWAQALQHPETKSFCPAMMSLQGAGKTSVVELFSELMGPKKVLNSTMPSRDVWGPFNGLMKDVYLVALNEVSKKDCSETGPIKGLITDSQMVLNSKGIDQVTITSYHRFIITTNNMDPIPTSKDDRRILFMRCSDELIGQKDFFKHFYSLLKNRNTMKTVFEFFMKRNIVDFDKKFHATDHAKMLHEAATHPVELWLQEFVMDPNNAAVEVTMTSGQVWKLYEAFCKNRGFKLDYQDAAVLMKKIGTLQIGGIRDCPGRVNGARAKVYNLAAIQRHFHLV